MAKSFFLPMAMTSSEPVKIETGLSFSKFLSTLPTNAQISTAYGVNKYLVTLWKMMLSSMTQMTISSVKMPAK